MQEHNTHNLHQEQVKGKRKRNKSGDNRTRNTARERNDVQVANRKAFSSKRFLF